MMKHSTVQRKTSSVPGKSNRVQSRKARAGRRPPIIDVHLHAFRLWDWVTPGEDDCVIFSQPFSTSLSGIRAANNTEELQKATFEALDRNNIVKAVASGELSVEYRRSQPDRILASPFLNDTRESGSSLRAAIQSGQYQALAEIAPQYSGYAPDNPELEPYYSLAEEMDIPLGIHVGLAPSGAAYNIAPKYRMRHGNALLLEDVLVRHPKLRLYVMHAAWPFLDSMIALLYTFPQVYTDISVINWYLPRKEFYLYFKRLVEAGFSKRILFGSDQMWFPEAIGRAVKIVEDAPFLSSRERRDIMYENAVKF